MNEVQGSTVFLLKKLIQFIVALGYLLQSPNQMN